MSLLSGTPDCGDKRRLRLTKAITVVEQIPVELDQTERQEIATIGRRLLAAEPALNFRTGFGEEVTTGVGPWPTLVVEDHSAIALFEHSGDVAYSYRSLLLAGDGDLVLVGQPREQAFEAYCRDDLGLGQVEIVSPGPNAAQSPLALRATEDEALVAELARRARQEGGLNLVAYMGTGGIWKLASRIAAAARRPVRVAAPQPRLARRVNDKSWFTERVAEVLGLRAAPPTVTAYSYSGLAAQVAGFVRRYPSVAVKLPDSASSAGNLVLESAELSPRPLRKLCEIVSERLAGLGWRGRFPVMVTAWERPILASPSAQLWIPDPVEGLPIVEGIFDQIVVGEAAVFSGAAPSDLPATWQNRISRDAVRLAALFQELGYFGRCSFDSILVGGDGAPAQVHWVECNGRWGGVSIPMTLTNRLVGDWTCRPPVIFERAGLDGQPRPFTDILSELRDDLYRPGSRSDGLVVLSPGRLVAGAGYEAMVLAPTVEAGEARARLAADKLLAALHAGRAGPPRHANAAGMPGDR